MMMMMMMKTTLLVGCVLVCVLPRWCVCYSRGASSSSCLDMKPGHIRAELQHSNTHTAVTIQTSRAVYLPQHTLTVTVRSSRAFMGFMLQARSVKQDTVLGMFILHPPGTHLFSCLYNQDTVTHSNKLLKRNLSFTWRAPPQPAGDIRFYITVVQSYFVYWARIRSAVVHDGTRSSLGLENETGLRVESVTANPVEQTFTQTLLSQHMHTNISSHTPLLQNTHNTLNTNIHSHFITHTVSHSPVPQHRRRPSYAIKNSHTGTTQSDSPTRSNIIMQNISHYKALTNSNTPTNTRKYTHLSTTARMKTHNRTDMHSRLNASQHIRADTYSQTHISMHFSRNIHPHTHMPRLLNTRTSTNQHTTAQRQTRTITNTHLSGLLYTNSHTENTSTLFTVPNSSLISLSPVSHPQTSPSSAITPRQAALSLSLTRLPPSPTQPSTPYWMLHTCSTTAVLPTPSTHRYLTTFKPSPFPNTRINPHRDVHDSTPSPILETPHASPHPDPSPVPRRSLSNLTAGPSFQIYRDGNSPNLSGIVKPGPPQVASGSLEPKEEKPARVPRQSASEMGLLLGLAAGVGMCVAVGLRYLQRRHCCKSTAMSLSDHNHGGQGIIHVQECGDLVQVRRIRQNSLLLLEAEYNLITPPGS